MQTTSGNDVPIGKMGAMQNQVALPYNFSLDSTITEAWKRVHGSKGSMWGALLFIILIAAGFGILNFFAGLFLSENKAGYVNIVLQIISTAAVMPLMVGISYLGVRRSANLPIQAKQIFSMYHYFWRLIGLVILQYFIIYLMVFLLILSVIFFPTTDTVSSWTHVVSKFAQIIFCAAIVYVSFSFLFSFLLIVEKNMGVFAAFKASFLAYSQHWFKITVGLIFMCVLYVLSFALLFIPAIWIMPMFFIFLGILYRNAFGVG